MKEKIQMSVLGISRSENEKSFYFLLLEEVNGNRKLPIVIGQYEAQAIAVVFNNEQMERPFMPDIFAATVKKYGLELKEVFLYKKFQGIYFTKMIWKCGDQIEEIEARPADAIALALRLDSPIFVNKEIIEKFAILPAEKHQPQLIEVPLSEMNRKQLNVLLKSAVKEENYERAAMIRDLIKSKL